MLPIRCMTRLDRIIGGFRSMSSSGSLVSLEVDNEGIATVTMQGPPVNSLNLDSTKELNNTLDTLEKEKCKAMILTSSLPTVFSGGVDINEIHKPDLKRLEVFWASLQDVWIKLFGSSFVTAAAINGHAPAGGCLLAMSCEYRVMLNGKFTIGMNETALGITATKWFMLSILNTISQRDAELALTTAKMYSTEEALKIGIIDDIATDKADAIEKCKSFIRKFDRIPSHARAITKRRIRETPLTWMQKNRQNDFQDLVQLLNTPSVQQSLDKFMEGLRNKSSKSK